MTFAHPALAILSAIVLPVVFVAQRLSSTFLGRRAFAYSNLAFMTSALDAPEWPNILQDLIFAASWSLLLAAASGPRVWLTVPTSPTIVICLDTSGSMNARDIHPSRAVAAAAAVRSFLSGAPPLARVGLVSFAGTAQRIIAPGLDRNAVLEGFRRVPSPNGQTAIGDGLAAAETMLPHSGMRAIVLITDGANNRGEDPRAVVQRLAALHIRLHAIAIGSAAERAMGSYAAQTGGEFARAGDAGGIGAQILRLASREFTARAARDCTVAFAFAALVLGAAAWLASAGAARR